MNEVIESIFKNTKAAYKESVIIDNEKLQDLLILVLADVKKLEDLIDKNYKVTKQVNSGRRTTYTQEQVSKITKIQLRLARDEISLNGAEDEILKVSPTFPIQHLASYNARMQKYLLGIGEYGFAFPSNWAKALIEETNYSPLVIKAFREQQALYLARDGRINQRLDDLLNSL